MKYRTNVSHIDSFLMLYQSEIVH